MPWQVQLADDLRAEQRHDVRTHRIFETWMDLFGDRGAAKYVTAFEYKHLAPGASEVRSIYETIVTAAYHDDVEVHAITINLFKW